MKAQLVLFGFQILSFLDFNQLLCANRHEFRHDLLKVTQLTEMFLDFYTNIDAHTQTYVICVDLSKTFDKVSQRKLLFKLGLGISKDV